MYVLFVEPGSTRARGATDRNHIKINEGAWLFVPIAQGHSAHPLPAQQKHALVRRWEKQVGFGSRNLL